MSDTNTNESGSTFDVGQVARIQVGTGLYIITGKAGEGKTLFVQGAGFVRHSAYNKIKYSEIKSIHGRIGFLALEVPEFAEMLFGVKVKAAKLSDSMTSYERLRAINSHYNVVGLEICEALDAEDFERLVTHVFTEADEHGVNTDILIDTFAPNFSAMPFFTATKGEEDIILSNVAAAIQLASIVNPVRISSATPSLLVYSKLPSASVKGGLNAGFIDSLNLINKDVIKLGGTIIAEVRDDWGDSEEFQKISGAGRLYGVAKGLELTDVRVRNVPGVFATDERTIIEEQFISAMEKVSTAVGKETKRNKSNGLTFMGEQIFSGDAKITNGSRKWQN